MRPRYVKHRFLIWGKTTPELSMKHYETVCTGAVLEDGRPIRIYPIPFRYLEQEHQFKKYQWMSADLKRDTSDPRPESFRIDCETIETGDVVKPDTNEWGERAAIMFKYKGWQFNSMDELNAAQTSHRQSIGIVEPKEIISVDIVPRPAEQEGDFEAKRKRVREKWDAEADGLLFEEFCPPELKGLEFIKNRIQIKWICGSGKPHAMQVIDWEVVELQRRKGDEAARKKVAEVLDLSTYATKFFLGNLRIHPNAFIIVGLWRPKRSKRGVQGSLFD